MLTIVVLFLQMFQWMGIVTRLRSLSLPEPFAYYFYSIFQYDISFYPSFELTRFLDFTVSWTSSIVHLVFFLIVLVLFLALVVGIVVLAVLSRKEKQIPKKLHLVVCYVSELVFTVLYLPIINTFAGALLMFTKSTPPHFNCVQTSTGGQVALLIFGIAGLVGMLFFGLIYHTFRFDHDIMKCDFFTTLNNTMVAFLHLASAALSVASVFLLTQPLILCIVCAIVYLAFTMLFMFFQPFFSWKGNSIYAALTSFALLSSILCLIGDFIAGPAASFPALPAIVLIPTLVVSLGISVGIFFLTRVIARSSFAMLVGDNFPIPAEKMKQKNKAKELHKLTSTSPQTPQTPSTAKTPQVSSPSITLLQPTTATPRTVTTTNAIEMDDLPMDGPPPSLTRESGRFGGDVLSTIASTPNVSGGHPAPFSSRQAPPTQRSSVHQSPLLSSLTNHRSPVNSNATPKVLPKFYHFFQFERAIRFIQQDALRADTSVIKFVDSLINSSQAKLGGSPGYWVFSSLFYYQIINNPTKAADALQHSKQCVPSIVDRWIEYSFIKTMENAKTADSGHSASTVFRTTMDKATQHADLSKVYLQQVWLMLSRDHYDMNKVVLFIARGIDSFWESQKLFMELLTSHPSSTQALRAYGSLLRDVLRDDEQALLFFSQANQLEEANSTQTVSDDHLSRISGKSKTTPENKGGSFGTRSSNAGKRRRRNGQVSSLILEEETQKSRSGVDVVLIVFGIVNAIAIVAYFVVMLIVFQEITTSTDTVEQCSLIQVASTHVVLRLEAWSIARRPEVIASPTRDELWYLPDNAAINVDLSGKAVQLTNTLKETYHSLPSDEYRQQFELTTNSFYQPIVDSALSVVNLLPVSMSILELLSAISNDAHHVSVFGDPISPLVMSELDYVRLNVPLSGVELLKREAYALSSLIQLLSLLSTIVSSAIGGVLIILVLVPCCVFVRAYGKASKVRETELLSFVSAPKQRIVQIKTRLDQTLKDVDEDEDGAVVEGGLMALQLDDLGKIDDDDEEDVKKEETDVTFQLADRNQKAESDGETQGSLAHPHIPRNQHIPVLSFQSRNSITNFIRNSGMLKSPSSFQMNGMPTNTFPDDRTELEEEENKNSESSDEKKKNGNNESPSQPQISPKMNEEQSVHEKEDSESGSGDSSSAAERRKRRREKRRKRQQIQLAVQSPGSVPTGDASTHTPPSNLTPNHTVLLSPSMSLPNFSVGAQQHPSKQPILNQSMPRRHTIVQLSTSSTPTHGSVPKPTTGVAPGWSSDTTQISFQDTIKSDEEAPEAEPEKEKNIVEIEEENQVEEEEDDRLEDLREKITLANRSSTNKFRAFLITGVTLTWILLGLIFASGIICTNITSTLRNQLYFSYYRITLSNLIAFISLQLPYRRAADLPSNPIDSLATRPGPNDMSHLSTNTDTLQSYIGVLVQYLSVIHRKLKEGASADDPAYASGDEELDQCQVPRTLKPDTKMYELSFTSVSCLMIDKTKCESDRLYGVHSNFMGLEGLIINFVTSAGNMQTMNATELADGTQGDLQLLVTSVQNDLTDGMVQYSSALLDSQSAQIDIFIVLIITVAAVGYLGILGAIFLCLLPARNMIKKTERLTAMVIQINPRQDKTLQAVEWNELNSCEIPRFDHGHVAICNATIALLKEMNGDEFETKKLRLCRDLLRTVFCVFADEESLMTWYKVNKGYQKKHQRDHRRMIQRLLASFRQILTNQGNGQTQLIQTVNLWLTAHIEKWDRELVGRLEGKIPQSAKEEEVNMKRTVVPPGFEEWLESEHCSMADRRSIEEMLTGLGLR
ncbi:hypothetical protein BLNAU_6782 [Blattamonas nauphoetae]|uniref:TmcB/TmcC TPR repeats domain-containing protein n=1 Tax=Blattamonas nauphoetae TaxID=2049346 RepID=A0ABQ9Y3K4_9EUKA|nr:hypothetical protein BLNAU_6782 [Blattamonas nauphoetae]